MGSKRLTPTTVGKMASKCLLFLFVVLNFETIDMVKFEILIKMTPILVQ